MEVLINPSTRWQGYKVGSTPTASSMRDPVNKNNKEALLRYNNHIVARTIDKNDRLRAQRKAHISEGLRDKAERVEHYLRKLAY